MYALLVPVCYCVRRLVLAITDAVRRSAAPEVDYEGGAHSTEERGQRCRGCTIIGGLEHGVVHTTNGGLLLSMLQVVYGYVA